MTTTHATTPHRRYQKHPAIVRAQAIYLHRMSWGGQLKIAKMLSRLHNIDLNEFTVGRWLRKVPQDLNPLATF